MKDIAFCAIIKNEARYLDEWLAYHYLIGVEHFYITDDNSTDDIHGVLHKWIKQGLVTYMQLDESLKNNSNRKMKNNIACCEALKNSWKYLGFLDIDEFFVPPNGNNIKDFLNASLALLENEIAYIYIRHMFFGLSDENSGLLTQRCLNHSNYFTKEGKTIVNPRNIDMNIKIDQHIFQPLPNKVALDFDFSPLHRPIDLSLFKDIPIETKNANLPRINHYFGKSEKELKAKIIRGHFDVHKNIYSIHNFHEQNGFSETFFNLASFSDSIRDVINILTNEFPNSPCCEKSFFAYVDELIDNAKTLVVSRYEAPQYIVSLTSYSKRLQSTAPIAIAFMLHGNVLPDRIILWVAEEDREIAEQNNYLKILQKKGLEIRYCENLKSYKKLIPALQEFPGNYIIVADDDHCYPQDWFEQIYNEHKKHPKSVISRNGNYDGHNEESPYFKPMCGAGMLFPPNSLHKDTCNKEIFMKLCPTHDEIWFWAMAIINEDYYGTETPIRYIYQHDSCYSDNPGKLNYMPQEGDMLHLINNKTSHIQFKALFEHYPQLEEIIRKNIEWGYLNKKHPAGYA